MSMGMVNKDTAATIPAAGNTGDKVGNLAALHTTVKSDIVSAVNEVKDEQANKADMDIVADAFSAAETYAEGDYCTYEGGLYKFKAIHSGAWDAADVDQIQIAGELSELKNTLSGLTTILVNDSFDVTGNGNYYKTFQKDLSKDGYELISISFSASTLDYLITARLRTLDNKRQLYGDVYRRDSAAFNNVVTISYGAIYIKKI